MLVTKTPADTLESKCVGVSNIWYISREEMAAGAFHVTDHIVAMAKIGPGYHCNEIWL
jgi:hypothetical protein